MIKLVVEDYCQNCPDFEADVAKDIVQLNNFFGQISVEVNTAVRCEHAHSCHEIKRFIEREAKNRD